MLSESTFESILKRDRLVVWAGLIGILLLAWGYMIHEARGMTITGVCQCFGLKMSSTDAPSWGWIEGASLFLMWTEMMVAMMVPTVAPTILTFTLINRKRCERQQPFLSTGFFLAGYLVIWTLFSLVAAAAQLGLHAVALLSPMMASTSSTLGGALLIVAGIYQWTPLKHACLRHCQSPLDLFLTSWRDGNWGAFRMGCEHGAFCTVCCGCLMTLLFVVGVMNIAWVAAITAFVILEKILSKGAWLGRLAGAVLIAWGTWMIVT